MRPDAHRQQSILDALSKGELTSVALAARLDLPRKLLSSLLCIMRDDGKITSWREAGGKRLLFALAGAAVAKPLLNKTPPSYRAQLCRQRLGMG